MYCLQSPNTKIDLALSNIGKVSCIGSSLNIEKKSEEFISTTLKEPSLALKIYEAIIPFMDAGNYPQITDIHLSKINTLLTSHKEDQTALFILSLTFMAFDQKIRELCVKRLLPSISNLSRSDRQYFSQYFGFLLEDEYTFGKELKGIETFLKENNFPPDNR